MARPMLSERVPDEKIRKALVDCSERALRSGLRASGGSNGWWSLPERVVVGLCAVELNRRYGLRAVLEVSPWDIFKKAQDRLEPTISSRVDLLLFNCDTQDEDHPPLRAIVEFKRGLQLGRLKDDIKRTKRFLNELKDEPEVTDSQRFGYIVVYFIVAKEDGLEGKLSQLQEELSVSRLDRGQSFKLRWSRYAMWKPRGKDYSGDQICCAVGFRTDWCELQ